MFVVAASAVGLRRRRTAAARWRLRLADGMVQAHRKGVCAMATRPDLPTPITPDRRPDRAGSRRSEPRSKVPATPPDESTGSPRIRSARSVARARLHAWLSSARLSSRAWTNSIASSSAPVWWVWPSRARWRLQGREVMVLEAEGAIGTGTSSRNSEVIHAGIYYPPGSLKARLCVEGKAAAVRLCCASAACRIAAAAS